MVLAHRCNAIFLVVGPTQRVRHVQTIDKNPALVLRLAVESGGCHGFQYKMSFTDTVEPND